MSAPKVCGFGQSSKGVSGFDRMDQLWLEGSQHLKLRVLRELVAVA
jgi:hypothetical protein